jgi:hypothetical protein
MIFLTKKGSHYCDQYFYRFINLLNNKPQLKYLVVFSESCRYTLNTEDQQDINKLFGFSLGFNHHQDSARFGWFFKDDVIHLYAYIYDRGVRKFNFIQTVKIGEEHVLTLKDEGDNWSFLVDNQTELKMKKSSKFKWGYKLWPFFGGNNPAPHDINIELSY